LAFVLHNKWEDPFEGFILKSIKQEEGKTEIFRILKELAPDHAMAHFGILSKFDKTLFGQSWTKCPESDALWRIYSNNKMSVRVEIWSMNVLKLIDEPQSVTPHVIQYSDSISISSQLEQIVDGNKLYLENVIITKRDAFEHEQEIRLFTIDPENMPNDQTNFPPEALKALLKKWRYHRTRIRNRNEWDFYNKKNFRCQIYQLWAYRKFHSFSDVASTSSGLV
ncbi:DUF2971 domain-containing protein, partial [Candidatus Latescibacterota bacterium]